MKTRLLLLFLISIMSIDLYAVKEKKSSTKPLTQKNEITKIVILPFYNYSDSGMKYLSDFMPELLKKNYPKEKEIEILDAEDISTDLKKMALAPKDIYNTDNSFRILNDLKADIGIFGRYIVHSKNIKIDFKVINRTTGKITEGKSLESVIDDNLLTILNSYAKKRMDKYGYSG